MRKSFLALAAAVCALVAATGAGAAVATPPFDAVMSGLDNPRGLAWGPEGALYVAEAGRGGILPCFATPRGPAFAGPTGSVSRWWHGMQERVATGFPSYTENGPSGVAATGPHDVALLGRGDMRVSIGLANDPRVRPTCGALGPMFGSLAQVPASGNWRIDADVSAYEAAANPDGSVLPDSNPYGLLAQPGATVATDAGGNDLLRIAANGSISTLAVFPSRSNSTRGADSVPTAVAVGPGGAYYVGELASFVPGGANVWKVVAGQPPIVFQSRLYDHYRHRVRARREPVRPRVRTRRSLARHAHWHAVARRNRPCGAGLGHDRIRRRVLHLQLQHLLDDGDWTASLHDGRPGRPHPRLTVRTPGLGYTARAPGA